MSFKVTPKKQPVSQEALTAFAAGADAVEQGIDDKRRVARFQIRLTDFEMAKLKHKAGGGSMHEFCLKAIQAALT